MFRSAWPTESIVLFHKYSRFTPPQVPAHKAMKHAAIRSFFLLMVMLYIPISWFVLEYFDCTKQEDGVWTLDAGGGGVSRFYANWIPHIWIPPIHFFYHFVLPPPPPPPPPEQNFVRSLIPHSCSSISHSTPRPLSDMLRVRPQSIHDIRPYRRGCLRNLHSGSCGLLHHHETGEALSTARVR